MDYSQLEDVEIPTREDDIYEEIENFQEYELTQCVAYEMAVRNKDVVALLDSLGVTKGISNVNGYLDLLSKINNTTAKELLKYGINYLQHIKYLFLTKPSLDMTLTDKIVFNPLDVKLLNILTENEIFKIANYEMDIDDALPENTNIDMYCNHFKNNLKNNYNDLEGIFNTKSIEVIKIAIKRKHTIPVETHFSRPKLELSLIPSTTIELNLELPEKELISYIKAIKQRYSMYIGDADEETGKLTINPNTPLEYLGLKGKLKVEKSTASLSFIDGKFFDAKKNENFPKKPNTEKYADMFFIYDYVSTRLKDVKYHNDKCKQDYEEKISTINSNNDLSTRDKREQRKQASNDYNGMKSDATIRKICEEEELELQLDIKADAIHKYYYTVKPYIEECRYKELITGLSIL